MAMAAPRRGSDGWLQAPVGPAAAADLHVPAAARAPHRRTTITSGAADDADQRGAASGFLLDSEELDDARPEFAAVLACIATPQCAHGGGCGNDHRCGPERLLPRTATAPPPADEVSSSSTPRGGVGWFNPSSALGDDDADRHCAAAPPAPASWPACCSNATRGVGIAVCAPDGGQGGRCLAFGVYYASEEEARRGTAELLRLHPITENELERSSCDLVRQQTAGRKSADQMVPCPTKDDAAARVPAASDPTIRHTGGGVASWARRLLGSS